MKERKEGGIAPAPASPSAWLTNPPDETIAEGSRWWLVPCHEPGLVSIVVPTFNRARLLAITLRSVVEQSYRPIELIVSDDGSTDNTAEVVAAFQARNSGTPIQFLRGTRKGACAARNLGAAASRGEFVKFLDSDDLLEPGAIAREVQALSASGADVCYGDWRELRAQQATRLPQRGPTHSLGARTDMVEALLTIGQYSASFTYMYRRSALRRSRGWNASSRVDQDIEFNLDVALSGARFQHDAHLSGHYRHHSGARISVVDLQTRVRNFARILRNAEAALRKREALDEKRRSAIANSYWRLALLSYESGRTLSDECLSRMREVYPGFLPWNPVQRLILRALGGSLGIPAIQMIRRARAMARHWRS